MAEILKSVQKPHECLTEIWEDVESKTPERDLWFGSEVLCSCGQRYRKEQDDSQGILWTLFA